MGEERKKDKVWGNSTWKNKTSHKLGAWDDGYNNLQKTAGIRSFYYLKSEEKKDVGPNMVAFITKSGSKIRTMEQIDKTNSKFNRSKQVQIEEQGSLANNTIYGLAKAETYFSRPNDITGWARKDGYREYGNLFNPFWQTRLIEAEDTERALAIGLAQIK